MAGRPAARSGGGMLYGMITFVILTVVFLGLFIWQLTDNKRLADDAARAQRQVRETGSPTPYYANEATARGSGATAVDVMNDDLASLASLVVGQPEAVYPAIEQESRRVLTEAQNSGGVVLAGDTLLTALQKLHRAHRDQTARIKQLEDQLRSTNASNLTLAGGLDSARTEFSEQVEQLQGELSRIQEEGTEQLAAKDEQLTRASAASTAVEEELSRFRVDKQRADRRTEVEVARLERQIDDLQGKLGGLQPSGFDSSDILTKADGRVLRSIPGSEIIYLNIGSKDRVRPGLTFEIYSPYGERRDDFRGKASVEVIGVTPDTAECRVKRVTANPIVENDVAVNIAYERNREPRFVIRGDFDLDYNGTIDWDGRDRVAAIIREWGGQVAEEVDESTDFVVIGLGPQVPDTSGRRQVTAVFEDLVKTRSAKLEAYQDTINTARTLYIPIVTQSQFLFLTGYAGQEDVLTASGS